MELEAATLAVVVEVQGEVMGEKVTSFSSMVPHSLPLLPFLTYYFMVAHRIGVEQEQETDPLKDEDCRGASPPFMPGKVIRADKDGVDRVAALRTAGAERAAATEKAAADMALLEGRVEQLKQKTEQLSKTRDELNVLRERAKKMGKLETEGDKPAEALAATAAEVPAALEECCELAKET